MDEHSLSYSLKRSKRISCHKASVRIQEMCEQQHLQMVESKENEEPQMISPVKTISLRNIRYLSDICVNANGFKIPCASERLPTHWHTVKYIGLCEEGLIRAIRPIPSDCLVYYFEVEVVRGGTCLGIGIGTLDVPLNYFPGWGDDPENYRTYGYHSDDGKYFSMSWNGNKYADTYGLGDVNGKNMGVAEENLNLDDSFYPMLGLRGVGEETEANFGQKPFIFDLADYIKTALKPTKKAISAVPRARNTVTMCEYAPGIRAQKTVNEKINFPEQQPIEQQDLQPVQHQEQQSVPSPKRTRVTIKEDENAAENVAETSLPHPVLTAKAVNNDISNVEQPVESLLIRKDLVNKRHLRLTLNNLHPHPLIEAGCKGSKCNKRRKNDEARNQDNDPLDKVEDMEAKKKEKPKSDEESEEEEEEKKKTGEEAVAARMRRAEKELRRQKELSEEHLDGMVAVIISTSILMTTTTIIVVMLLAMSTLTAKKSKSHSPQRVRRAHKPQDTDSTDDEEHNELDFKNIKNQWNKNYVRNSLPKRMEEAMKSGSSRQKKHLNHKLSDEEVANEESEKLQLNLDDIHISKFGKLGPRGRERVLPLPTEDRELPMWRKNYKEESEE
uniref:SPRY domain-containing protein n=1 Tax=Ditylenchus dipsaci TaxID=166011 RepID=A0A915E6G5_9BILA